MNWIQVLKVKPDTVYTVSAKRNAKVSSYISKLQSYGFLKLLELDGYGFRKLNLTQSTPGLQLELRRLDTLTVGNAEPFRSSEWKRLNVWQSTQLDTLKVKPDTALGSVRSKRNAEPFRSREWKRLNVWQSTQLDFLHVERCTVKRFTFKVSNVTSSS